MNVSFVLYLRRQLVLAVFLVIACVFLCVGGYVGYTSYSFTQQAQSTTGKVVAMESHPSRMYKAVIHYKLPTTDSLEYISSVSSNPPEYNVGDTVTILYVNNDVSSVRISSFTELWLLPAIFGGLGLVFAGIPIVGYVLSKRKEESSEISLYDKFEQVTGRKFGSKPETNEKEFANKASQNDRWLLVFPALGMLLISVAGYLAYNHIQFIQTSPEYTATVIDIEYSGRKQRYAYPLFLFVKSNGDSATAWSSIGNSPPEYQIGETALVVYNTKDNTVLPRGFFNEWLIVTILGFVGFFFTAIGSLFLFVFKK